MVLRLIHYTCMLSVLHVATCTNNKRVLLIAHAKKCVFSDSNVGTPHYIICNIRDWSESIGYEWTYLNQDFHV